MQCKKEKNSGDMQAGGLEKLVFMKGLEQEALSMGRQYHTLVKIISTGLGDDVNLKIVPGDGWRYYAETNEIVFPVEMLLTASPEEIVGFSAHEAGHRQISRQDLRKGIFRRFFSRESTRLLLNAFEDTRVDNWLIGIFKGIKHYLDITYEDLLPTELAKSRYVERLRDEITAAPDFSLHPYLLYPHLEYLLGVRYYWRYGSLPSQTMNPEVEESLDKTHGEFEAIFQHYPQGRVSEREKYRFAEETARMIEEKILPEYDRLVSAAVDRMADAIKDGKIKMKHKDCSPDELTPKELREEARKLVDVNAKELADRFSSKTEKRVKRQTEEYQKGDSEEKETITEAGKKDSEEKKTAPLGEETLRELIRKERKISREQEVRKSEYERVYLLISNLIQTITGILENHFAKNKRPSFQGYFPSGQKPDLRRAMELSRKLNQEIPVHEKDLKVFLKRKLPTQRDHKIVLALDESGSMDEPKRTSALAGLLVFMEALEHIGIDYAVLGFADSPVVHKELGSKLNARDRRLLFEEVAMCIPAGSTADANTLQLATEMLKDQPQDALRWIIMVTDGEGNVNTTGKSFAQLQEEAIAQKIEVLGVGLDKEVTEVKKRYQTAIQVENVEELPAILSGILEERLITQDVFWENMLHSPEKEEHSEDMTLQPLPVNVSELMATIYLHQKHRIPTFNIRHLKRASEQLGFLLDRGYPEKESFFRSFRYAFTDTQEQPQKVRDLLLEKLPDIEGIFPDFHPGDMYPASSEGDIPVASIPRDMPSLLDILIKSASEPRLEKALSLLKELITSTDKAYVCIPGLEACFRLVPDELVRGVALEELEDKLADTSWSVRQTAAIALGRSYLSLIKQGKEVDPFILEDRLQDEDPTVCRAAADFLGRIWYQRYRRGKITSEELEEKLQNTGWSVRLAAARALGLIYPVLIRQGKEVKVSLLEDKLWDKSWFVRQAEAEVLGQVYPAIVKQGGEIDVNGLEERLKDKNMLVRQSTSLSLGRIYPVLMRRGNEIDLRKLEDRLDDDDWAVRQAAAQALGRIWYHSYHQGKITLKEIEEKLEDLNWSVRQAAAQTLGQIYPLLIKHGSAVRLKKLEERLWDADVDRSVCRAAAIALGRIWPYSYHKKKITLKALEEKLKDENWFVHQAAALAMINIYPSLIKEESDAELNKLERRLKDKDWTIRQAAARACIKILSSFIFNRQDALNNVLASFNKLLGEPMQGTISGTHSRQIEIGEKTLTVGDLVLERESPNEDIPACVMTSTGYHILETLGFGYLLKHSVLLLGPTSTGKSFLIKWLSQVLGFRHLAYAINPFTSKFEIIGGIKPDSRGRFLWQEGILLKAAREGLWLVLEEINLASSEVVEILNDFLITGKMSYSENGEQRELYPHPDFRLFATGNPESYSQRQKLSEIFLSRFKIFYQKELSEEELSQVLSSLFRMSASLALLIARFHITLQNQADSRIIGMGEKDPYAFTLRDIIRLGKRLEPFLKQESEDVEFLRKLYLEFFCVYIGRIRNEAERDAMVSLLDTYFGFRAKGLDLDAVRSARSVDLMPLMKSLTTSKGSDFVPQQEAEISPTPTQKMNLYLILKALINHEPVLLVGNPASGKTTLVRYLAREKQTNLFFVNLSSDTGIEELLGGYIQDGHGNWHYRRGLLFTAIEQGSWLLIDEANLSPLSEYLNTLLDFGYVVDEKENVCHAHPNFRLFLAINPPSVHQSRNLLSPALKSRFAEIWVDELTNADELASLIDTWSHAQSTALGFQEKKMDKRRILDKKAATDKNAEKKAPKKEEATAYKRYTHFTT
jgi:MoxR-like ATPase/HEAT repeat protein/uncharacterized protein YegL